VGKPQVKRPRRIPRRRYEDNIKMDVREIECGGMKWIDVVQDKDQLRTLVNTVMNI
jgi:hypothetical protein